MLTAADDAQILDGSPGVFPTFLYLDFEPALDRSLEDFAICLSSFFPLSFPFAVSVCRLCCVVCLECFRLFVSLGTCVYIFAAAGHVASQLVCNVQCVGWIDDKGWLRLLRGWGSDRNSTNRLSVQHGSAACGSGLSGMIHSISQG